MGRVPFGNVAGFRRRRQLGLGHTPLTLCSRHRSKPVVSCFVVLNKKNIDVTTQGSVTRRQGPGAIDQGPKTTDQRTSTTDQTRAPDEGSGAADQPRAPDEGSGIPNKKNEPANKSSQP